MPSHSGGPERHELPEDHRRRRLAVVLTAVMVMGIGAGFAAAWLTRHHHPQSAHTDDPLLGLLGAGAGLAILVLTVPFVRALRRSRTMGTPDERRRLADLSSQERVLMLRRARTSERDDARPDLQALVVQREVMRARWGQYLYPILALLSATNALRSRAVFGQVIGWLALVLLLAGWACARRDLVRLQRFLRGHDAAGTPGDSR